MVVHPSYRKSDTRTSKTVEDCGFETRRVYPCHSGWICGVVGQHVPLLCSSGIGEDCRFEFCQVRLRSSRLARIGRHPSKVGTPDRSRRGPFSSKALRTQLHFANGSRPRDRDLAVVPGKLGRSGGAFSRPFSLLWPGRVMDSTLAFEANGEGSTPFLASHSTVAPDGLMGAEAAGRGTEVLWNSITLVAQKCNGCARPAEDWGDMVQFHAEPSCAC